MSGIYIHIPFCKQACHYCDFHFSTSLKLKNQMITSIIKEIQLRSNEFPNEINSLYIGGGTPSLMENTDLELIFTALEKQVSISDLKEITIEINPEDLHKNKLEFYKSLGINRLSIGIQSMDNKVLKWMNRVHDKKQVINGINNAKEIGFENISLDFIYGTPSTLNRNYQDELLELLEFKPTHLSCYHLTIESGTYFGHLLKKNKIKPLEDDVSEEEFLWISNKMKSLNYEHYEISNFAIKGEESYHNSNYWKQRPYIGLGPGAHSFNKGKRRWNISNNVQYIKNIESNSIFHKEEVLSNYDSINEQIMLGLRTSKGLDLDNVLNNLKIKNKTAFENKLNRFINEEIIFNKNNNVYMNPEKWLLSEYISRELFILSE
jgi:oxygen-independent coproporphyrinogen-3 oxidase